MRDQTQGLGNIWLALDHAWFLTVASVATQAIINLVLLHRVMRRRLN
jgi:energy-converting hydrogenase Eha subunit E